MSLRTAVVVVQAATFLVLGALIWRSDWRLASAQFLLCAITMLVYL